MKYIFIILIFISNTLWVAAQPPYVFEQDTDTYLPLNKTGKVTVTAGRTFTWTGAGYNVPIGFDFKFYNGNEDSLGISSYYVGLLKELDSGYYVSAILINLYSAAYSFRDRGWRVGPDTPISKIWYRTDGVPGNRIFKVEYYNVKTSTSTQNDSINFQVWLHEKDNSIEYRYGPGKINTPYDTFFKGFGGGLEVGLRFGGDTSKRIEEYLFLKGSYKSPIMVNEYKYDTYIDSLPLNGTIYRFTPKLVGIKEQRRNNQFKLYPNPVNNVIQINEDFENYFILNMHGQTLKQGINNSENIIQLENYPSGIYFLRITNKKGSMVSKFIKN